MAILGVAGETDEVRPGDSGAGGGEDGSPSPATIEVTRLLISSSDGMLAPGGTARS